MVRASTTKLLLALAVILASCGEDAPEIPIEKRLEDIAGSQLSPDEISRQLDAAATLCQMNEAVLVEIWNELNDQQFEFQDFVFSDQCPDRSVDYALATGRAVTADAVAALSAAKSDLNETEPNATLPLPNTFDKTDTDVDSGEPTVNGETTVPAAKTTSTTLGSTTTADG